MALYLRGNVWWYELRTRARRVQVSTGLKKTDKKKAKAVFDAARMAFRGQVSRSLVEGMMCAIYGDQQLETKDTAAISSINEMYEQWQLAKGRTVTKLTDAKRRSQVEKFRTWADVRGIVNVQQVTTDVARAYAAMIRTSGVSNKTQRNTLSTLGSVWRALADTMPGIHNPWAGVIPDRDGSSVRRGCFTPEEETRLLDACERVGQGWKLASMISRWTALRYGDVAHLQWDQIDMKERTIAITPSKTARHGVSLLLPIADALYSELSLTTAENRVGWVLPGMAIRYPEPPGDVKFSDILRECGLDPKVYTFHSWRHTCASRLSESGASVEMLRRFGGWTSDKMANHYDHAQRLEEMRAAIERAKV